MKHLDSITFFFHYSSLLACSGLSATTFDALWTNLTSNTTLRIVYDRFCPFFMGDTYFSSSGQLPVESSHSKLGTNLGCLLTFPDGMMANHPLFSPNFTIFGVKCPFFHGWHPLFFLQLASLLDFLHPLKKKMDVVGQIMAIWPQKHS